MQNLPLLPTGNDVCSAAVRSVAARGFHDGPHTTERHPLLTAQYGRLVEEISELLEVSTTMKIRQISDEMADVMIVLCQMAWLHNMQPVVLLESTGNYKVKSLPIALGWLWRAIRKDQFDYAATLIMDMAHFLRLQAQIQEVDLQTAMIEKMASDEQRGIRHEGDNR